MWDVDASIGVRLPTGIINPPAGGAGSTNGGPGTGHSEAANIYGNQGAFPPHNGVIPQTGNLSLHIDVFEGKLKQLVPDASFSGVCLLDFETMRADWNSSVPAMRQASILHAGNDTALAKRQYEAAARRWFEASIDVVRRVRPGCLVGWYGYPQSCLPHVATPQWTAYCKAHPGMCWWDKGGAGRGTGYAGPGGDTKRALNDGLSWLFAALDVITPSIYLGETAAQTSDAATTGYVEDTVREAVRLATATGKHTKVMPCAWLNYDNYWDKAINQSAPRELLSPAHAAIELGGPLAAGADGLLIWGHLDAVDSTQSPNSVSAYNHYSGRVLEGVVGKICTENSCCRNVSGCWGPPLKSAPVVGPLATARTALAEVEEVEDLPVGDSVHQIEHGGRLREFQVYVPPSARRNPAGLAIYIHGFTHYGVGAGGLMDFADVRDAARGGGFIAVTPDGTGVPRGWNAGGCCGQAAEEDVDDVGFISLMIDYIKERADIPAGQVFAGGDSNGGMMAYRLGCELCDKIFGVSSATGNFNRGPDQDAYPCSPMTPRPVINFHGTRDFAVPYESARALWREYTQIQGCSGEPELIYRDPGSTDPFKGAVECVQFTSCGSASALGTSAWCTYDEMGHSWPGSSEWPTNLGATRTMWAYWTGGFPQDAAAQGVLTAANWTQQLKTDDGTLPQPWHPSAQCQHRHPTAASLKTDDGDTASNILSMHAARPMAGGAVEFAHDGGSSAPAVLRKTAELLHVDEMYIGLDQTTAQTCWATCSWSVQRRSSAGTSPAQR